MHDTAPRILGIEKLESNGSSRRSYDDFIAFRWRPKVVKAGAANISISLFCVSLSILTSEAALSQNYMRSDVAGIERNMFRFSEVIDQMIGVHSILRPCSQFLPGFSLKF
jgi:hypothetical protein